jgi:sn1-specific diacylglycerol lipase
VCVDCCRAVVVVVLLTNQSLWGSEKCAYLLRVHLFVYLGMLCSSMFLELGIGIIAMRGSILDTEPRAPMQYFIYSRMGELPF